MQKAIVIGCPGAGKSTFARALRDTEGLPLYYLDMLWHRPDRTNISAAEFDAGLKEIVKKKQWIIDGNYQRTLEMRLQECDTVFLLDYPLEVCLLGAESRIGKSREDLPWMETELDEEFRQWIVDFPKEQLPQIYELLDRYREGRRIVVFHARKEAEDYLRRRRLKIRNFQSGDLCCAQSLRTY
ncbi:MAG TPA: adenylate kinase [Lachnospiraceae bacterium]|nr:adenylate kinase [Lachnospiraceae bacterium]